MLTHYKGTCHPPHSSRCAASNLSLGSGAPANLLLPLSWPPLLSFSLFLFVLTAFVQYIHRLARLDSETRFQTPDHASSTGAPAPPFSLSPSPSLRSFFHSSSSSRIPRARSLPSRSRFHSLLVSQYPSPASLSPSFFLLSALFQIHSAFVTRPFSMFIVFLIPILVSSADTLFLHLAFSSLFLPPSLFYSLAPTLLTRAQEKRGRKRECIHVCVFMHACILEGVVPSSIATAVSAFLRNAPHTRCRYILSV